MNEHARVAAWLLSISALLAAQPGRAGGELFGTLTTEEGEQVTGTIRWDKNENFWDDILDVVKEERYEREDGFQLSIFGWKIGGSGHGHTSYAQLTIPFGHIRSIEPAWDGGGSITLKSGETIEAGASADLGESMRGLVVRTPAGVRREFEWADLRRVEFRGQAGPGLDAQRLYGDVKTAEATYTGFVVWDLDESLREDVLDGYHDGRARDVRFSEIAAISKSSRGARVRLTDGAEIELTGTNDVNSGNRGIDVTLPGLGKVQVRWRDFESLTLNSPPPSATYEQFDGGRTLRGKLTTVDALTLTGRIIWDDDEQYTWEALDGEANGVEYAVPFGNVRSIRPTRDGARVELHDGRTMTLDGSNDVNASNRGVSVISPDGTRREFEWRQIDSVAFDAP